MRALQQHMVALAEEIRQSEILLGTVEEKQRALSAEKKQRQKELQRHRREIGASLQAMLRLSKTPPEAVIAMPGELRGTLRASSALGVVTGHLQKEAGQLAQRLKEMDALEAEMQTHHRELTRIKEELETHQRIVDKGHKKRKALRRQLQGNDEDMGEVIATLSRRARTLKELLQGIENQEQKRRKAIPTLLATPRIKPAVAPGAFRNTAMPRDFVSARGKIRLPVTGKISSFFDDKKGKNEKHPGITISSRPMAQVVAPFDGEVVFTGPFLEYGHMVIIRHTPAYYTLLAGMERIDCVPGQALLEGEPLGRMGEEEAGQLYVELRKHNKPVDPQPWFGQREARLSLQTAK